MFKTWNYSFNFFGVLFQIAGVVVGVWIITHLKYREKGIFNDEIFNSNMVNTKDDKSDLPKNPRTNEPIIPIIFNKKIAYISIGCLLLGLILQIIALNFSTSQ